MKKLIALLAVFLLVGCASIKNEYECIEGKTSVKQISQKEVLELFESGSAVVLFAFPGSEWAQEFMPLLNEEALKHDVEVLYYNIHDIRESETEEYKALYDEVFAFVETTEFDSLRYEEIYVPTIVKLENGTITDFHYGTVEGHVATSKGLPALTSTQKQELTVIIQRLLG
jgi:uncharacterized protein YceK